VTQDDDEKETPTGKARKERVLHTRVPAVLEEELKRLATNLRMPVSNVVRAILEDAVEAVEVVGERAEGTLEGIVDRISAQRQSLKDAVRGEEKKPEPKKEKPAPVDAELVPVSSCPDPDGDVAKAALEGVIGFQRLALLSEATCTVCQKKLPRGSEACRGVREESGPRVLLGPRCTLVPGSSEIG
jgi:hypothetical protein